MARPKIPDHLLTTAQLKKRQRNQRYRSKSGVEDRSNVLMFKMAQTNHIEQKSNELISVAPRLKEELGVSNAVKETTFDNAINSNEGLSMSVQKPLALAEYQEERSVSNSFETVSFVFEIAPMVLKALSCLAIVGAATTILINSTMQFFGSDALGMTKALILELSVLGLMLMKPKGKINWISSRALLCFLVYVTLGVLDVGAAKHEELTIQEKVASDTSTNLIMDEYNRKKKEFDALPDNYVSKRSELSRQLKDISNELKVSQTQILASQSIETLKAGFKNEKIFRVCLIAINLIFGHIMAGLIAGLYERSRRVVVAS
jgi:hypothetical protein